MRSAICFANCSASSSSVFPFPPFPFPFPFPLPALEWEGEDVVEVDVVVEVAFKVGMLSAGGRTGLMYSQRVGLVAGEKREGSR